MSGTRKRTAGEGTVFQSANGRWVAMIELPRSPDGRRRRKLRRARTRAEAQRLLREMRDELDRHGSVADGRRTMADAVVTFDELLGTKPRAKSTLTSYRWMLDLINTGLGRRRVCDLTVQDCDEFLKRCASGLTPTARAIGPEHLRRLRATLVAVVRNELRLGVVSRNVAELSVVSGTVARQDRSGRRALTREELRRLLDASSGAVEVFVDLTGRNGLRPAEARALTWAAVDPEGRLLRIDGQMDEDERASSPKTAGSRRTIRLDSESIRRLSEWRAFQRHLRKNAGSAWIEHDFVVTTGLGTPINRNNLARSLRSLCTRAGIEPPIVPYELRHTAISHQADLGRSSWQIADWCGSSERLISDTYRHRLSELSDLTPAD